MIDISDIVIRNAESDDYHRVVSVMPGWWGGRDLSSAVQKIFFIHFQKTTFIAEKNSTLCGFLIGFMSQSRPDEGYIHFAGVHPEWRRVGLGRNLYERFFEMCRHNNRFIVRSCTSPINTLSVEFHQRLGFIIEQGDTIINGVEVTANYLGAGDHKVLFKKDLSLVK